MAADSGLRRRAEERATADEWQSLHELLQGRDEAELLESPSLGYRWGEALYHTGRYEKMLDFAGRFEEAGREAADPAAVMRALNLACIAAFELGRVEHAREAGTRLMSLAEAEEDLEMLARAATNLGNLTHLTGLFHEALAHYRLALPLYQRLDSMRGLAQVQHNLGISHRDLGELDEADDAYRRAATLARQLGYRPLVILASLGRAELAARRGDPAAGPMAERGLASARQIGNPAFEAEAHRVLGLARAASGRTGEALESLAEAVNRSQAAGHRLVEAEAERDRGRLLASSGQPGRGRDALERARDIFEELGARAYAREARDELADLPA